MAALDVLRATNEVLFNMPLGAGIQGSYMWQPPSFSFPIRLCYEEISVAKKWSWENCLHVLSFPNSSTSKVARPPVQTDKASYKGLDVLGPCMDFSVHVLMVVFNYLKT